MILKFKPVFISKIWAGNRLNKIYNIDYENIGECWGISGHSSYSNYIYNHRFTNLNIRDLYRTRRDLFGYYDSDEFPIIIKFIDAKFDLSLQVHPDNSYAKRNEKSLGKDECWYILDADDDSTLIIGHNVLTKSDLQTHIENGTIMGVVNKINVKKGDFFYIPANTLHAICSNTFLLEVSQSSDITYRVYDYDRLQNGQKRELHLEHSKKIISVPDNEIHTENNSKTFTFKIKDNYSTKKMIAHHYGDYITVLNGTGYIGDFLVKPGDFLMATSNSVYKIKGSIKYHISNLI